MSDAFWQMVGVAVTALAPVILLLLRQNRTMRREAAKAAADRDALLSKMTEATNFMNTVAVSSSAFQKALDRRRPSGFGELDP